MIPKTEGAVRRQFGILFEAGSLGGWGDGALLERFLAGRDATAEAAFAALVERHGPMVLRVCRARLGDDHEAHDAFQAVFLVLARKARTVRIRDTVGPWLHGVAWRVASRARVAGLRRRHHERRAAEMAPRSFEGSSPRDDAEALLHEEVRRLPAGFREAVILCDLEGLTTDQAAERLGLPVGTIRSRLYRGRDRLRGRLIRRGLAPAAIGAVVASGSASALAVAIPSALAESTIRLAIGCAWGGMVPARLAWLMHGGRHVMGFKGVAALGMSLGLVVGVGGLAAQGPGEGARAKGGAGDEKKARIVEQRKVGGKQPEAAKAAGPRAEGSGPPNAEAARDTGSDRAADPAADARRLQGRWTVMRVHQDGKEITDDRLALRTFTIGDGQIQVGPEIIRFRIEPGSEPPAMRVAGGSPQAGWWLYAIDGDRLRFAYVIGEHPPRATSFEGTGPDPQHPLEVLELVRDATPPVVYGSPSADLPQANTTATTQRAGASPPADARPLGEQLQGTWSVLRATLDGQELDGPNVLLAPMTFRGDTVEFGPFGNPPIKNRYRFLVDPEGEPKAIRVVREGASPRWWVFELKGEKLRMAAWQSIDETGRPAGFDDRAHPLMVLELVRGASPSAMRPDVALPAIAAGPASLEAPAAFPSPGSSLPGPRPSLPPSALEPLPPAQAGHAEAAPPAALPAPPASALPPSPTPAPAPAASPGSAEAGAALPPAPEAADDLARLQGTWEVVGVEESGAPGGGPFPKTLVIAGNAMVSRGPQDQPDDLRIETFTLRPNQEPKTIDILVSPEDAAKGRKGTQGIYRVDGAVLLLCIEVDLPGKGRPTEFDTKPGSNSRLIILRRKKSERPATPPATPTPAPAGPNSSDPLIGPVSR